MHNGAMKITAPKPRQKEFPIKSYRPIYTYKKTEALEIIASNAAVYSSAFFKGQP
jgi:hypothetical protein